jgi:hypothetical protein
MTHKLKKESIFTPELIKLIKIFGFSSIIFVFILSFFDGRRAMNSGTENSFRMLDSNKIFFLNVRSSAYDREYEAAAKLMFFRPTKRQVSDSTSLLNLVLILNTPKDEAYLHLEPVNFQWPIRLRAFDQKAFEEFTFVNGNKFDQKTYIDKLRSWIDRNANFELESQGKWISIWDTPKEKEVLKTIFEDYLRLLNQHN